jgi:recombination protein RecT
VTGTEIEKAGDKQPTVRQLIQQMTPEIKKALPGHLDAERVARIAITLIGTNPALQACTPESFLGALMTASQLGLEPGPLGEAYLVPYGKQVTFIAGYKGLIKLAFQSGQLKRIAAHVIREHDDFDFAHGLDPYLTHKPKLTGRGDPIGVYAAAVLANGERPFVVMSYEQVEAIRRRSKAAKVGPWVSDWDAMARKTAVRQLARWLPMSTDLRDFGMAVALDGSHRDEGSGRAGIRHVEQVAPAEETLELEAPVERLDAEQVRAAANAAKPAPELSWHDLGHPGKEHPRRVWEPDCEVCDPGDEARRSHYYGHTVDWVEDCVFCQQEKAWKAEDTDAE